MKKGIKTKFVTTQKVKKNYWPAGHSEQGEDCVSHILF